eukprot:501822-Rhodomonas_salina.3
MMKAAPASTALPSWRGAPITMSANPSLFTSEPPDTEKPDQSPSLPPRITKPCEPSPSARLPSS